MYLILKQSEYEWLISAIHIKGLMKKQFKLSNSYHTKAK